MHGDKNWCSMCGTTGRVLNREGHRKVLRAVRGHYTATIYPTDEAPCPKCQSARDETKGKS